MIKVDEVQPAQDMPFNQNRYEVDCFKSANAKRVPYEELEYGHFLNIGEQTAIMDKNYETAISTQWLQRRHEDYKITRLQDYKITRLQDYKITSHWEEQDSPKEPSKCEKVVITLSSKEKSENIICITIYIDPRPFHENMGQ
jgi:hypothetical protein